MRAWACTVPAALLLLFVGKAFHIDDTLFINGARLIAGSPLDPYSGSFLYYDVDKKLIDLPNPLLWMYLMAATRALLGEHEWSLHLLPLAFGILGLRGLRLLAIELGVSAPAACWFVAASSAFLALGSTVMPDLGVFGLAVAAVAHLVRGVNRQRTAELALAGLLAGMACITRYSAVILVALLAAYPVLARRWHPRSFLPVALALATLFASEAFAIATAGRPHFLSTLGAWSVPLTAERLVKFGIEEVIQLGGQMPLAWLAVVAIGLRSAGGLAIALLASAAFTWLCTDRLGADGLELALFFGASGAVVLLDALVGFARRAVSWLRHPLEPRDALRALLALWLWTATFVTISYVHVAAKYLLLASPAAVLLLLDSLGGMGGIRRRIGRLFIAVSLSATLTVGLLVAWSDYRWAGTFREFCTGDYQQIKTTTGINYYSADWGLRYYAERAGMRPYRGQPLRRDDRLIYAIEFPSWRHLDRATTRFLARVDLQYPGPVAILNRSEGAGFYSNGWGPYPYRLATKVTTTLMVLSGR